MSTRDELNSYIGQLQRRLRLGVALRGAAVLAGTALATTVVLVLILNAFAFSHASVGTARAILVCGLILVLSFFLAIPLARLNRRNAVGQAENLFPQFQQRLITFAERDQNGHEPFLDLLAADTLEAARNAQPAHAVPDSRLMASMGAGIASLGVLLWMIFAGPGFMGYGSSLLWAGTKSGAAPLYSIKVTPGDVTVRRNADQLVTALPMGLLTSKVRLFARYQSASQWEQVAMQPQSGASGFQFLFAGLPEGVEYYVEAGAVESRHYNIHVVDMPGVKKIQVTYHYPSWAGFKDVTENQGGDLSAVQGTNAELGILMDRPLRDGVLVVDNDRQIPLTGGAGNLYKGTVPIEKDGVYHVAALDHGQPVRLSGDYFIAAAPPNPPQVAIARPQNNYRASPIEEVTITAHAEDDYGLSALDLHYSVNGGPEKTTDLLKQKGVKQADGSTVLALENFKLIPGDVVSLYATAKDARADTRTDIFFIQADPFERDFSQSQSSGGGGGSGGSQNDQSDISQREKELIAATWKQQGEKNPAAAQSAESAKFLSEVQAKLAAQTRSLAERMQSRELSQANQDFNSFVADMNAAAQAMDPAADKLKDRAWKDAMPNEQKALQNLLRAEATFREIEVAFGNRGGGGGGGAGRDLASLFDLELDTQKNQYETAQTAGSPNSQEQKVDDALKKLDDLARRQQELANQQRNNSAQSFQERWQQELLRRNAEELQRQLEQLAQNNQGNSQSDQQSDQQNDKQNNQQSSAQSNQQSSGQSSGQGSGQSSGQSGRQSGAQSSQEQSGNKQSNQSRASAEAARRALEQLRQATDAMSRSSSSPQQSEADARNAADRLRQATSLLGGAQQQQASGRLDAMAREADRLSSEQKAEGDRIQKAFAGVSSRADPRAAPGRESRDQLAKERQQLSDDLSQLRKQMQDAERELASTQRPAASKLRDALGQMEQNDLTTRMQRSADWLRRGFDPTSNSMESGLGTDLAQLSQQMHGAQQALGSGNPEDASNQSALDEVQRLRDQLQALGRDGRGNQSQQQGQAGRPGQNGNKPGQNGQNGQNGQGRQVGQLGRDSQPGQNGQPGQSGAMGGQQNGQVGQTGQTGQPGRQDGGNIDRGYVGALGGRNNQGGLTYGGVDTGNNSDLPQPVTPDSSPKPGDQEATIQQGVNELNQVRQSVGDDPATLREVQELIHEMQGLDPNRFPGNPAVYEALHQQVLNDVDKLEVRLKATKGDQQQLGQIRSTDADTVPSGYQDAVAEYFRKLSKNQ
jgi:hypothetical protein